MRRHPRTPLAVLLVAITAMAACGDDSDQDGFEITGTWGGELRQQGFAPFHVRATIGSLDDPARNTVHYTGIACGGNWTYLGGEDPFRFREVINRGAGGKCKGVGTVTLGAKGDDSLAYAFVGGGVKSEGTLHRVNP